MSSANWEADKMSVLGCLDQRPPVPRLADAKRSQVTGHPSKFELHKETKPGFAEND
jgi:hypothetical protein